MLPEENSSKRPRPEPGVVILLAIGGILAAFVGVMCGLPEHFSGPVFGAGLMVFGGLCFVAAAIIHAAHQLRK